MGSRRRWTDEIVELELRELVHQFGRMPSCEELRSIGMNGLSCRIVRTGGFLAWAERLGMSLKNTETHRGNRAERLIEAELVADGYSVTPQTTRAPFDLDVSGVQVDVKSSQYADYPHANGGTISQGYFFCINKRVPTCDLYVLCCMDGEEIETRYYVPSQFARVSTLTITTTGKKYRRFGEAPSYLRDLVDARAAQKVAV